MNTVSAADVSAALKVSVRTVQGWPAEGKFPVPKLVTVGRGRPQMCWNIAELPATLTIKGKVISVREAVQNNILTQHFKKEPHHEITTKARSLNTCSENGACAHDRERSAVRIIGHDDDGGLVSTIHSGRAARKNDDGSWCRTDHIGCGNNTGRRDVSDAPGGGTGVITPAERMVAPHGDSLNDQQRECNNARAIIVRFVRDFAGPNEQAIEYLNAECAAGRLPKALIWAFARAWDKPRSCVLNRSIFNKWVNNFKRRGHYAPVKCGKNYTITKEMLLALKYYQAPQKPSLRAAVERAASELNITDPRKIDAYYHRANRFKDKVGTPDLQHGRMGAHDLRRLKPFIRRDTSQLYPGDVYTADGHKFDAEVANPRTGKPFRPEITSILDVATRKLVGWSIDLAESGFAVLYALTHAISSHAIPLIFYVDNGSGYNNTLISGEGTGMLSLLNIRLENSLPYNSQAKGLIERSHQTLWVKAAKKLPTYIGADMDKEAKQKVFKITRKQIKEAGKSHLLIEMDEFREFIKSEGIAYNDRPQRGLPRYRHPEHGTWVHHTPNSYWTLLESQGKLAERANSDELQHLIRPQEKVSIRNGEIRLFNNLYFSADLEAYHGEDAKAAYETHDASRIWVYSMDGRFICHAEWNANKRAYFPQSIIDQQLEKRAKGRMKRAQIKVDEAFEELNPPQFIEHQPSVVLPIEAQPQIISIAQEISEPSNIVPLPVSRPMFTTDAAKYRWLKINASQINEQDDTWLDWYVNTDEWNDLFGDVAEVAAR
jgi:putative transposase